jgi:hypothetical protein
MVNSAGGKTLSFFYKEFSILTLDPSGYLAARDISTHPEVRDEGPVDG